MLRLDCSIQVLVFSNVETSSYDGNVETFLDREFPKALYRAIETAADTILFEDSADIPPKILARFADQTSAIVHSTKWDDEDALLGLIDHYAMTIAAAELMYKAALAAHDPVRARQAVIIYDSASKLVASVDEEERAMLPIDESEGYRAALMLDADLNRSAESAKLAASMYLEYFNHELGYKVVPYNHLSIYAGDVASAYAMQQSIDNSSEAQKLAVLYACKSLVYLRWWQKYSPELAKKLAQNGQSDPRLTYVPPASQTEAYKILRNFGKDPDSIFSQSGPKTPESCS